MPNTFPDPTASGRRASTHLFRARASDSRQKVGCQLLDYVSEPQQRENGLTEREKRRTMSAVCLCIQAGLSVKPWGSLHQPAGGCSYEVKVCPFKS